MAVQVVTPQNMIELITTGRVERPADQAPSRRETIALKRDGKAPPPAAAAAVVAPNKVDGKSEAKPEPKEAEPPKEEPKTPLNLSEKVDDKGKAAVKDAGADPSAKPTLKDIPEDQLPEHVRKIIGKKHREMKEATEFAEFQRLGRLTAEKRVADLEAQLAKAKPAPTTEPARAGVEPQPEDFPNVAAYTKALVKWEREQADQQRTQLQAQEVDDERESKASENWQTRYAAAIEADPEFEDRLRTAFKPNEKPVAKAVMTYIKESEVGPQLLNRLATHPDEMATFRSLNAERAIGFLGRLEEKLEAKPVPTEEPAPKEEQAPKVAAKPEPPPAKNVSKAPPPVDTSVGSGEPLRKDPADMSTQEYLAHRKALRRAASGR